ncbi:hypothetical protein N7470_010128 [Penicillium chermesinum]|nr:hypothetical protein N7470_010128 [Penicillium chermesinum]
MTRFKNAIKNLQMIIVRIPLLLQTILLHAINRKQDLRTELITVLIRSFITRDKPLLKVQEGSLRDPGIKGPMWVSKVTLPQPEFDVRDAVLRAIKDLGDRRRSIRRPRGDRSRGRMDWISQRSGQIGYVARYL